MKSIHAGLLGMVLLSAAVSVACSDADVEPARQQNIVGVADVRTGSVGTITTVVVRTTVTSTKTVDRTVARAKTVAVAPRTVTVTAPARTVTAPARTVTAPAQTVTAAPRTTTVISTLVQTETEAPVVAQGLADTGSVYYANCSAARAAGAAPVRAGDPGYRSALDRDGDGIGCE